MRKPPRSKRWEHFLFNLSRDPSKCFELLIHPILIQVINEKIAWLEEMPTSWRHRRRRWRTLSNPSLQSSTRFEYHILSSHDRSCFPSKNILLQGQGGAPPGDDGGDEDEMDKDELWASSPLQISAPHLKDTSSSAPWGRAGDCRQDDRQVIKVGSLSQRLYFQN